jgi:hypothetical protein
MDFVLSVNVQKTEVLQAVYYTGLVCYIVYLRTDTPSELIYLLHSSKK